MKPISQYELANFEKVDPPLVEKSNFAYSFSFLPKDERSAISSVYAFCSYIDDIVDSTPTRTDEDVALKLQRLMLWEDVIEKIYDGKINNNILKRCNNDNR